MIRVDNNLESDNPAREKKPFASLSSTASTSSSVRTSAHPEVQIRQYRVPVFVCCCLLPQILLLSLVNHFRDRVESLSDINNQHRSVLFLSVRRNNIAYLFYSFSILSRAFNVTRQSFLPHPFLNFFSRNFPLLSTSSLLSLLNITFVPHHQDQ